MNRMRALFAGAACLIFSHVASAWPPGFTETPVDGDWVQTVGVAFAEFSHDKGADTRMLAWEKGGRVWIVEHGVRGSQPLIDISEEVGNWRDYGLLGFAVDPEFHHNGYIYLGYVVDYHHLKHFGTPEYDPQADEYFVDTIARVTRFTCDPATGFRTIIPGSRHVLLGESITTGVPITHQSHGMGTILFGLDGSLIVTVGEGASYDEDDVGQTRSGSSNTALADGILTPETNVGALRSQMIDSLSGKVLRLDPETGDGLPDNPFFDAENPRAARSRVWALGFRNPCRAALKPGSATASNPVGVLCIGDVGSYIYEELDVCDGPGQNFGWPLYEGIDVSPNYPRHHTRNPLAPNPLHTSPDSTCPEFFEFSDLLVNDTLTTPSYPNPCDPTRQVPASIPRFVHKRPTADWRHYQNIGRIPGFLDGVPQYCTIGNPGCVPGPPMGGNTSLAGVWYTGTSFPRIYHNTYFHIEWTRLWLHNFLFDEENKLTEVRPFESHCPRVVCMAVDPETGDICYAKLDPFGPSGVFRIQYTGNQTPELVAVESPRFGVTPLTVSFNTDGTTDRDDLKWGFLWDFQDGTPPSTEANPVHVFEAVEDVTAQGDIVARVQELSPPMPLGGGSPNAEVIRDGDYPGPDETDPTRQYDTFHNGDQFDTDWIGYTFPSVHEFRRVIFQEGVCFPDGGWFNSLAVEVRSGGVWTPVKGLVISPEYQFINDGRSFDTYYLSFPPVSGDGLRLRGCPGGENLYISVAELRVFASQQSLRPTPQHVRVTAVDARGGSTSKDMVVSLNNTPPTVHITSPIAGRVEICGPVTVQLQADVSDAENSNDELTCQWDVVLLHNTHGHPEPPIYACSGSALLTPHGAETDTFSWRFSLTVTDSVGLWTTEVVELLPSCCRVDWDHSGVVNSQDFFNFLSAFFQNNADINVDGITNSQDFFDFLAQFFIGCD